MKFIEHYLFSCKAHFTDKAVYKWLVIFTFFCSFPVQALALTCADLEGASVYSQELTPIYLGFFGGQYATESIMNNYGTYGSTYASLSVRNEFGSYGSAYASYSANNDFTSTPPRIYKSGVQIAFLTTNSYISGGISLLEVDANCTFYASFPSVGDQAPLPPSWVSASDGIYVDKIELTWV